MAQKTNAGVSPGANFTFFFSILKDDEQYERLALLLPASHTIPTPAMTNTRHYSDYTDSHDYLTQPVNTDHYLLTLRH